MKQSMILLAIALAMTCSLYAQESKRADESKEFKSVVKELDVNGNFLMFMNAKQVQKQITDSIARAESTFGGDQRRRQMRELGMITQGVKVLYSAFGLNEVTSFGMSSISTGLTAYRNVIVIRTKDNPKGLAWNLFGSKPAPLKSMDILPKSTYLATATDIDLNVFWKWLETQGQGGTPMARGFNQATSMLRKNVDVDKLLKGFGGHIGIVVTMNDEKRVTLPLERQVTVTIPSPGFGIFLKVNDGQIQALFETQVQNAKTEVSNVTIHGVTARKFIFSRYSGPIELTPMVATYGGYLYITSNTDTMTDMLAVATKKEKGFTSTDEFKKMAGALKPIGNSYHIISSKLGKISSGLLDVLPRTMSRSDRAMFQFLLGGQDAIKSYWSYGVMSRRLNGFHMQVNSTDNSGIGAVLQFAGAPLAVGAGMTFPVLSKARVKAQRANSGGNLKQIGLAMLGYSGDYGGDFPKKDGVAGLNRLLETNDLPLSKVYVNPRDSKRMATFNHNAKKLTEKNCSYAYVGGGLRDDNANSTTMPLIWEKPHEDDWCNVLFIDGHVQGFGGTFKSNVDIVKAMTKRGMINKDAFNYYMKKAMIIDNGLGIRLDKLPKETVKTLDALIEQLGADDFKTRKKAQTELKKHMPKAYQYLLLKFKEVKDPEIKTRIKKLIEM